MADNGRPMVVALEEHYCDPGIAALRTDARASMDGPLFEQGPERLKNMDANGIDVQVISHIPWRIRVNAEQGVELAAQANNRLHEAVQRHPDRFAGFATLPMQDPQAAADELERAVTKLGFKGAMIFPLNETSSTTVLASTGTYVDHKQFWPIYERAEALDVPIYLHPAPPHEDIFNLYFKDYEQEFPNFSSAAWGFGIETATTAIRMILNGVFDAYPNLKIILGHLGEYLPYALDRIDEVLNRRGGGRFPFREYFCEHFYVTTSGFFSTPALLGAIMALGIDRVMFSVDWPMVANEPGVGWMKTLPLCAEDRAKIYSGNARRLLKL